MQIQISAGDTFHYTTPDFILTALVGQTITYGTGKDNVQVVTNGLEGSVDIDQIRPETFSTGFIEDIFDALQIDDPAVVDAAIDAFGFEAERLFAEVLADNSAIEEIIAALNEIFVIHGLAEAASDASDALQAEDDSLDIVAILGLADQIYQDLGTGTDFSISIDSGDSFDFMVGETTVTKLLGQTVSHVSGDDNRQTIVNGFDNEATGSGGSSGGGSAAATAASSAESSQAGFSIVIETGDDFTFNIGETSVVKMFGQTVSYISGDDNDQTITNGPVILGDTSASQSSADEVSNQSQAAATEVEAELPNILITTGDSISFDLGTTSITKMFGQTVSYVAGDHNVQTVTNGISVDTDPTVSSASATLEDPQPSMEELFGTSVANSESSDGADPDKIIEILTKVADIVGKLEDPTDVSIVIETGHNFFFNIGDAEVTKMFGQTVSYVAGDRNDQTITNGFDVTDVAEGQFSDFGNIDFAAMDVDSTQQAQALASEFGEEAEQLLDDILTDGSAIAEVVAALDDIFSQSDLGSISDLIDERQNDDDSTDMVAILELVRQIRNDLAAGSELSILIESGDDFEFNIESTSVTKMFGQTVSYVNGNDNQQTVVNGFEVTTGDASESVADSLTSPIAAASQIDESSEDEADDGFSIVIDAGDNFVFNVGTADIVKMFGQTVSYAAGTNITQTVINGFSADLDGSAANQASTLVAPNETRMDEAVVFPIEDAEDEDETPNILIEANDTYTFDVGDVEIVKMFGQTVSYASGRDITQDVGNGFEASDDTSDSSDVSFWSDESGTDSSSIEFGVDDTSNSERAIEALTLVAELIGDVEDPSEFSVAIQSGNDFGFDVAEADVVKLYGQTVSRADGTGGTQDVEDGPVADPGGHFVSDIDSPCLGLVYRMYVASLGRAPDEEGLRYWIDILEDLKANTPGFDAADYMADRFIEAHEFEMLYGANPTDADYVEALYWNVLERASDAAGHDYWVGRMEAGLGFDDMLVSFVQSDEAIANISPDYEDDVWVL